MRNRTGSSRTVSYTHLEDTEEKVARFNSEVDWFQKRWKDVLQKGDPYYSPNLTLDKNDFSLTVDVR